MTRAHVRLLGPCFKTGQTSIESRSAADRVQTCPRAARNGHRTQQRVCGLFPSLIPSDADQDNRGSVHCNATEATPRRGLPPSAIERHPTGRDVLPGGEMQPTEPLQAKPRRVIANERGAPKDPCSPHHLRPDRQRQPVMT